MKKNRQRRKPRKPAGKTGATDRRAVTSRKAAPQAAPLDDPGLQGSKHQLREDRKLEKQGYRFVPELADRVQAFFERYLTHSAGEFSGRAFRLEQWQLRILRRLFGWVRPNGTRRYRRLLLWIPRKNGKSTLASGIALYLLTADGEAGAQIYAAATNREQAEIVFDAAKNMATASPDISSIVEVYKKSLFYEARLSRLQAISSKAGTKHGLNPHGIIADEIHAWPSRELYDVLTTASGARRQPLEVVISTAGSNLGSFGYELFDTARKLQDGVLEDPWTLAVVYAADPDDDYSDPAVWRKANPNLGVSISEEYLREKLEQCKQTPSQLAAFKQLHLNLWTQDVKAWLQVEVWKSLERKLPWEKFKGRRCWAGLDLSSTKDLTAFYMVFSNADGTFDLVGRFWCPREQAEARAKQDRVQYPLWIQQKHLIATPGNVVDYDWVEKEIADVAKHLDLQEVAYDPWGASGLAQRLQDQHGITMVEFRQGFKSMSEPSKDLERLLLQRKLRQDGNPVMTWMVSNVVVEKDPAENIKPSKKHSRERIDGVVALVMGLARARLGQDGGSVYDDRGVIVI